MTGDPALDLTPGDPAAAAALAARFRGTAAALDDVLRLPPTAGWSGTAARACGAALDAVATGLAEARDALHHGAGVLDAWSGTVTRLQARARARPATGLPALVVEHAAAASAAAAALRRDRDSAVPVTDVDATGAGAARDAAPARGRQLDEIGDVAGSIAGVAGALAFVPVLTPVAAPVALAAGAVALAADVGATTLAHRWTDPRAVADIAVDVVALAPGVRFVKGVAEAAAGAAEVSGAVFRTIDGLGPTVTAGAETLSRGEVAASAAYRQPGVWAVLQARALASRTPLDAEAAARRLELAGRLNRVRVRWGEVGKEA